MKNLRRVLLITIAVALLVFSAACGQVNSKTDKAQSITQAEKTATITVSVAASLKDVMEEIKDTYIQDNSNTAIIYNFGGSGSLQQQIEQGAEVDVFLSAAVKQMDALEDKGLILEDTRRNLLGNRLVLVIPNDSSGVRSFEDLTGGKVRQVAVGTPESVPAGQYAEEAFAKLGILDKVKSKMVYGKDVKEVLAWVETGNADAGIVYETDARVSDKVRIAAVASEDTYKPIVYPAAVIKESKNLAAARSFINFLYSEKARLIFERYGFSFIAR